MMIQSSIEKIQQEELRTFTESIPSRILMCWRCKPVRIKEIKNLYLNWKKLPTHVKLYKIIVNLSLLLSVWLQKSIAEDVNTDNSAAYGGFQFYRCEKFFIDLQTIDHRMWNCSQASRKCIWWNNCAKIWASMVSLLSTNIEQYFNRIQNRIVGLMKLNHDFEYSYICGGSLISEDKVLTGIVATLKN